MNTIYVPKGRAREYSPLGPGRTLLSNGYIGVRVPAGHHLRFGSGYAYEHRLVAEQKLGRRLQKGEIVHHINGIKTDNSPENLEVEPSRFHHKVEHRKKDAGRRLPGQENETILCACGCGKELLKFDDSGRPREFIMYHSWRKGKKGGWE
jgi:hypothetical protein